MKIRQWLRGDALFTFVLCECVQQPGKIRLPHPERGLFSSTTCVCL